MQQASLTAFSLASHTDFCYLKAQIDRNAQAGHVYDYPTCRLLPGCDPDCATVGFWQDKLGYLLYVRPAVIYRGTSPAAARLFRTGQLSFATFAALEAYLKSLSQPAPPPTAVATSPRTAPATRTVPAAAPTPRPPSRDQLAGALGQAVLGQEEAVALVAQRLAAHTAKRAPARPLSLLFYGPTGVGKSELGKQIAPVLNQYAGVDQYQFVWTELNTFTEPHSVYRLTGAPPGYVGYDDTPIFEAVQQNPRTVFMFDELEKAHPEVLKTFMSVLDEGRCAARKPLTGGGRELDFRRCILLFTTNADLSAPTRPVGFSTSRQAVPTCALGSNEEARRAMASQGVLREIAGRFGCFVPFVPLSPTAREAITAKQITALGREYGLTLTAVSPALVRAAWMRAEACGAFSVRSHTALLEDLLSPLFSASTGEGPFRLEGSAEDPRLVPSREASFALH